MNITVGQANQSPQLNGATQKFLSSVTSLSVRLPSLDHLSYNSKAYMKIKSDEFMFAKSSVSDAANSSSVVIVPTDDPKLKAVIIPEDCLTQQSQSQSFQE